MKSPEISRKLLATSGGYSAQKKNRASTKIFCHKRARTGVLVGRKQDTRAAQPAAGLGETSMKRAQVLNESYACNRWLMAPLLILTFAIGTAKDLQNFKFVGEGLLACASTALQFGMVTVQASNLSPREYPAPKPVQTTDQFRWSGRVAPGQSIEIKGVNGDIAADAGSETEVIATKVGQKSDPTQVSIKVIEHASGVTICAVYPSDDPNSPNTCEPGSGNGRMNVRNNDVRVNFKLHVPAGVNLIARTVNGEISAQSLSGNVDSKTVNGDINVSTTGYAQAKTVNGDVSARLGSASWPEALEFKTVNGEINVELPSAINARVDASTSSGDISSDFPMAVIERQTKKRLSGTIGSGGHELSLKTVNGDIHLRRVG
jgi:hypothetical protein